jgi:hypothetical protein
MKQALHIFVKDVRHFWGEILVSVALVAALTWAVPMQWNNGFTLYSNWKFVVVALRILIVVSWWLMIARIVHEESLVGDRQFWLTRPYGRKSLLAAKALFLICFLYLPMFMVQISILAQANLDPVSYIPGLLYKSLMISAYVVLPAVAIATVTSNLVRMTLAILGIWLIIAASLIAENLLTFRGILHARVSTRDFLTVPTALAVCAAVVLVQYMVRRLAPSRIALLALPPVLVIYMAAFTSNAAVNRSYPRLSGNQAAPVSLSLPGDAAMTETAHETLNPKQVEVEIPLQVSGAGDEVAQIRGVRVDVEGENINWRSDWQRLSGDSYRAGHDVLVHFLMSRETFVRIQPVPVTLRLRFAINLEQSAGTQTIPISMGNFAVPGVGVCSPLLVPPFYTPQTIEGVVCREAFPWPKVTFVETSWTEGSCQDATGKIEGAGWFAGFHNLTPELIVDPVLELGLPISNEQMRFVSGYGAVRMRPGNVTRQLCPGTPITFTQYRAVRRFQTELTIQNFRFPAYEAQTVLPGPVR